MVLRLAVIVAGVLVHCWLEAPGSAFSLPRSSFLSLASTRKVLFYAKGPVFPGLGVVRVDSLPVLCIQYQQRGFRLALCSACPHSVTSCLRPFTLL